jgi:competence protein ComGC
MTRRNGFTLIDLLVGLGIVTVLVGLYVPGLHHDKKRIRSMNCIVNLKQIGVGLRLFANDHDSLFPAKTPQKEGGLLESVSTANPSEYFLKIADELPSPKILICPHDTRRPAEKFNDLQGSNVSYAIYLDSF